jgi:hypothetical protein
VISETYANKQEGNSRASEGFEEFKLEFYEALLDLIEDLRRIKSERQKDQKEDKPKPAGI